MGLKKFSAVRDFPGEPLNGTATNLTELPSNILEAFIPGYSLISRFILDAFGFDISLVVSVGLLAFAVVTSVTYVWDKAFSLFQDSYMSNVYIDDSDDLYDSVLEWIADQRMSKVSRSIKAVTRYGMSHVEAEEASDGAMDEQGIFNYGKWSAKIPPRYEPYFGSHHFWHGGRLFMFDRSRREVAPNPFQPSRRDEELIKLSCIGRSTLPIKSLLDHVKFWSIDKETAMTVIRRPASKDRSRYAGAWDRLRAKPSRPMDTVALDPAQKEKIIADINEYLHPSSPRWYATRGIPYRRGYLFHGPPGVGKTSLAYALAGIFGLDIYNISLLEPTLTESDLNRLFNNLPQRCIVLLEDIDSAGLLRDEKSDQDDAADPNKKKEEFSAETLAKALTTANRKQKQADETKQGISLSGLLNAIDGVATHEGRVLVMTTNHPEKLDDALIRPGRVDMQVEFSLATHEQMRDIFIRMYSPDEDNQSSQPIRRRVTNNVHKQPKLNGAANGESIKPKLPVSVSLPALSKDELRHMADKFAEFMPEGKLSPAEVQNFLLTRKKEPERALEEVEGWCKALLDAKERKEKVVRVQ
ncbi:ATPase AAA+ type core [Lasiodiplodia theobromae]|uniref:Putative mitochondrial chaperone BCS1-B n=1 Tax=Lasiodiplodia theobromae TaxID=45133 RepID=A0A5N5DMI9_9PEZI|nr:ATPAse AAA+ type core protein [Lasiodiplodia theobromae]KAB2578122.1 putative mitochondrial chaperone BCS1-B [Lasiodiplodia theobromae]KAF4544171.1 ATPAse AAA+ type core protein [Lasiodiplodia theobromae]KAF9641339.1 ATPase AAA+ type core [Lasiodiplodia theobromae]